MCWEYTVISITRPEDKWELVQGMDTEKKYIKKSSACPCWSASAGRAGVGFLCCFFLLFSWLFVAGFFSEVLKFVFPHSLPKPLPNFPIPPSPSNPSRCRSLSNFSIHQLKCSSPPHAHPHKAVPKNFFHRPEKTICRAVPKGTHLSCHHSSVSCSDTLCLILVQSHSTLPTVFHDRSKRVPKKWL